MLHELSLGGHGPFPIPASLTGVEGIPKWGCRREQVPGKSQGCQHRMLAALLWVWASGGRCRGPVVLGSPESQLHLLLRVWEGHPGLSPWEVGDTLEQWPEDTTATLAGVSGSLRGALGSDPHVLQAQLSRYLWPQQCPEKSCQGGTKKPVARVAVPRRQVRCLRALPALDTGCGCLGHTAMCCPCCWAQIPQKCLWQSPVPRD